MKAALSISDRARVAPHKFFVRAAYAAAQAAAGGGRAADYLAANDATSMAILQRDAAPLGTTTDAGWAAELSRDAFRDFLVSLEQYSGAARLIAQAMPAVVDAYHVAHYPIRTAGRAAPAWVAEGGAIPVISSTFDDIEIGPAKKMASIIGWSREADRRADARNVFETMLREDVAAGIDGAFFATTAGSSSAAAGLLNGVSAIEGYAGGDITAMNTDLAALAAAVAIGGSGSVTFVMAPQRLAKLRILAPELAMAIDAVPSAAVPADRVIAADGPSLLVSVDSAPDISVSENGLAHMDTSATAISAAGSPNTVAAPVRSMWQTAALAMRVIYELDFRKRRSAAVAYVDNATW